MLPVLDVEHLARSDGRVAECRGRRGGPANEFFAIPFQPGWWYAAGKGEAPMPRWLTSFLIVVGFLALVAMALLPKSVSVNINISDNAAPAVPPPPAAPPR